MAIPIVPDLTLNTQSNPVSGVRAGVTTTGSFFAYPPNEEQSGGHKLVDIGVNTNSGGLLVVSAVALLFVLMIRKK